MKRDNQIGAGRVDKLYIRSHPKLLKEFNYGELVFCMNRETIYRMINGYNTLYDENQEAIKIIKTRDKEILELKTIIKKLTGPFNFKL